MGQSIAIMNTKGGVGKSTIAMGIAETASTYHGKSVLLIDSDPQTSMSIMMMPMPRWEKLEREKKTLVHYLAQTVLGDQELDWKQFVATKVSDVEDATSIYLMPSHMELSLFERAVSEANRARLLRTTIRKLLDDAMDTFDLVIIDCPPGISILTEIWLREVDYYLPPTKPDYLSARGLAILGRFRELYPNMRFASNLGVVINMKDIRAPLDEEWHGRIASIPENRCFSTAIPRRAYIQRAADYDDSVRSYPAKYPGDAGDALRSLVDEFLYRLSNETEANNQGQGLNLEGANAPLVTGDSQSELTD